MPRQNHLCGAGTAGVRDLLDGWVVDVFTVSDGGVGFHGHARLAAGLLEGAVLEAGMGLELVDHRGNRGCLEEGVDGLGHEV